MLFKLYAVIAGDVNLADHEKLYKDQPIKFTPFVLCTCMVFPLAYIVKEFGWLKFLKISKFLFK